MRYALLGFCLSCFTACLGEGEGSGNDDAETGSEALDPLDPYLPEICLAEEFIAEDGGVTGPSLPYVEESPLGWSAWYGLCPSKFGPDIRELLWNSDEGEYGPGGRLTTFKGIRGSFDIVSISRSMDARTLRVPLPSAMASSWSELRVELLAVDEFATPLRDATPFEVKLRPTSVLDSGEIVFESTLQHHACVKWHERFGLPLIFSSEPDFQGTQEDAYVVYLTSASTLAYRFRGIVGQQVLHGERGCDFRGDARGRRGQPDLKQPNDRKQH